MEYIAQQPPLSVEFPRREYWSGLPFPPPGCLPDPGIKPAYPALAGRFFTTVPPGKSCSVSTAYYTDGATKTQGDDITTPELLHLEPRSDSNISDGAA